MDTYSLDLDDLGLGLLGRGLLLDQRRARGPVLARLLVVEEMGVQFARDDAADREALDRGVANGAHDALATIDLPVDAGSTTSSLHLDFVARLDVALPSTSTVILKQRPKACKIGMAARCARTKRSNQSVWYATANRCEQHWQGTGQGCMLVS